MDNACAKNCDLDIQYKCDGQCMFQKNDLSFQKM